MSISGFDTDISKILNSKYHKTNLGNPTHLSRQNIEKIQNDINDKNYSIKTHDKDTINVVFALDEGTVGIALSKNTLDKLQNHFKKSDFIKLDDKVVLNEDAANFVSSWFKEIAFNLGLANADKDNSGRINNEELRNAKIQVNVYGYFDGYQMVLDKLSDEKFIDLSLYSKSEAKAGISISEYLDSVLASDRDFNGELKFNEVVFESDKEEKEYLSVLSERKLDIKRYKNEFSNAQKYFAKQGKSVEEIKNKQKEKELEQAELLAKLMQIIIKIKKMGANSLTNDESNILKELGKNAKVIELQVDEMISLSESLVKDIFSNNRLDILA